MDFIQILGFSAALLTTAANIPQAYKIIRDKSTKDISALTYSMLLSGLILWIVYGIKTDDLPVIMANSISALISTIILVLKFTSKENLENLHDSVSKTS